MSAARHDLAIAAAWLEQGRIIDGLSRLLTALALLALVLLAGFAARPSPLAWAILGVAILAGGAQIYFAIRVGFDAALFRWLSSQPAGPDLNAFDTTMQNQGLLPPDKAGRPLGDRIAGARRLFGRQTALLVVQIVVLFAGAVLAAVR
jgi:hypothetical protein